MATQAISSALPATAEVFSGLPSGLRRQLLDAFNEIVRNFRERRWEPAELNGGKLSEVAYTIVRGFVDGHLPASASKPSDMLRACQAMEKTPVSAAPRSVRIQIPRMLVALYEIRNNRSVGHVGGDVDPNHMDALVVLQMAKWVVAELVRVLHQVSTGDATAVVESLSDRTIPVIWEVGGRKRVLRTDLSMRDKSLLLLHTTPGAVAEQDLVRWVEHSNASVYRRDILRPTHRARLVEYDTSVRTVEISPLGIAYVEEHLPLEV
jgi:hypothetical protein